MLSGLILAAALLKLAQPYFGILISLIVSVVIFKWLIFRGAMLQLLLTGPVIMQTRCSGQTTNATAIQ